jgi:hypothetical protein
MDRLWTPMDLTKTQLFALSYLLSFVLSLALSLALSRSLSLSTHQDKGPLGSLGSIGGPYQIFAGRTRCPCEMDIGLFGVFGLSGLPCDIDWPDKK